MSIHFFSLKTLNKYNTIPYLQNNKIYNRHKPTNIYKAWVSVVHETNVDSVSLSSVAPEITLYCLKPAEACSNSTD